MNQGHLDRRTTAGLGLYLRRQADSPVRYVLEQLLQFLFGWIPTPLGMGLRAVFYRLMLKMQGLAAIEPGVRLCFANHLQLAHGVYLDRGVYIHACPQGVMIGAGTLVMHGVVLHVYNFRDLPHAGIHIGRDSLIGEYTSWGVRLCGRPVTQGLKNYLMDYFIRGECT